MVFDLSAVCKEIKVVADSQGLVDFAIRLVIADCWESAVFWGNSNYRRIVINPANQKGFWGYLK